MPMKLSGVGLTVEECILKDDLTTQRDMNQLVKKWKGN